LAASIYNARAGLKPLVIAGSPPGGQLILTSEVENYPGFESIMGQELIDKMRKHALKFGVRFIDENVIKVDFSKRPFKIYLPNNEARHRVFSSTSPPKGGSPKSLTQKQVSSLLFSKSVIIATGAKAIWLGLESEQRLRGKGVSACATCDGFFFRDRVVGVVGGGDTALEEALTLTKFAKKVYIIHRRREFRGSKIMQERVFKNKKIEIIWNAAVEEIMGENKVTGIKIKSKILNPKSQINNKSQTQNFKRLRFGTSNLFGTCNLEFRVLPVDGVFIAIGHKPDTDLFKRQVELDEKEYVKIIERRGTSVPGVFVAGDCADPYYRQAITSAGTGVEAALEVERYLENTK